MTLVSLVCCLCGCIDVVCKVGDRDLFEEIVAHRKVADDDERARRREGLLCRACLAQIPKNAEKVR